MSVTFLWKKSPEINLLNFTKSLTWIGDLKWLANVTVRLRPTARFQLCRLISTKYISLCTKHIWGNCNFLWLINLLIYCFDCHLDYNFLSNCFSVKKASYFHFYNSLKKITIYITIPDYLNISNIILDLMISSYTFCSLKSVSLQDKKIWSKKFILLKEKPFNA